MGTKPTQKPLDLIYVLEQCNSIWVQNGTVFQRYFRAVLEQCNSIWVQNNHLDTTNGVIVLEQCNSIWVQNKG